MLIPFVYNNAREASATREGRFPYLRHAIGDFDAPEVGATTEGIFSYLRHAIGNFDARETVATEEGFFSYLSHAIGNYDAREASATREGSFSYLSHAIGDYDMSLCGAVASYENAIFYFEGIFHNVLDIYWIINLPMTASKKVAYINSPVFLW